MNQAQLDLTQLNPTAAKRAKDAGMQKAIDNAGKEWAEMAYDAFCLYARTHLDLTTEAVRAANPQIPAPPDKRAWGAVAKRAARAGIVEKLGLVKAQSPTVHCMYVTSWASKVLDLTARISDTEWKKLARNYLRAFRMNVRGEGFIAMDVITYAENLGCPEPPPGAQWFDVFEADGLEWSESSRGWHVKVKPCCAECAESHA
jgi:hypothetical protein